MDAWRIVSHCCEYSNFHSCHLLIRILAKLELFHLGMNWQVQVQVQVEVLTMMMRMRRNELECSIYDGFHEVKERLLDGQWLRLLETQKLLPW